MKNIVRFEKDYETNEKGKIYLLEVCVVAFDPKDNLKHQEYLEEKGFRFDSIDADSIHATVRSDYNILYQILKQLQDDGWDWE